MQGVAAAVPVSSATVAYHWAQSCRAAVGTAIDVAELPRALKACDFMRDAMAEGMTD